MHIEPHALEIVNRLRSLGYIAYFAGGWVRDFVMKRPSEDIDIATNATPETVLSLFPKTIQVGVQFGVVIVCIDKHQYEVSSFRSDIAYVNGRKPTQVKAASPEEDALRRDFTINGMFYDPVEKKIYDYVEGLNDIERRLIRTIGDPKQRFFEDRLRMIRAFRFAARLGFTIEETTREAIRENASLLFPAVAMERIWQEFCKMYAAPGFEKALLDMHRLEVLPVIFPELDGLHLKELEARLSPIKHYPRAAAAPFFLAELFPSVDQEKLTELGRYLKIPNKEILRLETYCSWRPFSPSLSRYESARFYSHPDADLFLAIYAARLGPKEREAFLKAHEERKLELDPHIKRLDRKRPLISSSHLSKAGISPGKSMGLLLKEAERLSVEHDCKTEEEVLEHLYTSSLWRMISGE
jgi:poly(A) polymerase